MLEDSFNACSSILNFEPVHSRDSLNDNPATPTTLTPTYIEEQRSISELGTVFSTSLNLESSRNSSTPDFVRSVKFTKHWIMNPSSHRIVRLSSRDQGTLCKSENVLPVNQNVSSSTQNFKVLNFPDSPNIYPPTASNKGLTCLEEDGSHSSPEGLMSPSLDQNASSNSSLLTFELSSAPIKSQKSPEKEGSLNTPPEIVLHDRPPLFDRNAKPEVIDISKLDFGRYPQLEINTSKRKWLAGPRKFWIADRTAKYYRNLIMRHLTISSENSESTT